MVSDVEEPELDKEFIEAWDLVRVQCPKMSKSLAFACAKLKYQMVSLSGKERLRRQAMFDAYDKSLAASRAMMEERDPVRKMINTIERFEQEWQFFVKRVSDGELIGDEKRECFIDLVLDVLEIDVARGADPVLGRQVVEKCFRRYSFPVVRKAVCSLVRSGDLGAQSYKWLSKRCETVDRSRGQEGHTRKRKSP